MFFNKLHCQAIPQRKLCKYLKYFPLAFFSPNNIGKWFIIFPSAVMFANIFTHRKRSDCKTIFLTVERNPQK